MALIKQKVFAVDDNIVTDEPTAKDEACNGPGHVLALVPKSSRRRCTAKKVSDRRRVKPTQLGKSNRELTPEEALAQAWEYTYNHRKGFQQ